ncbi:TetR/AcrR family transcriptional regulator [Burkholderia cenocepacia]|uniref:TetR/AcrR family transcriptional regulator n=1 Tax=Burkholderia cenocepacia TaxID=95486 RepID=UPI0019085227|nr:TetR/AcrR family transcriptional regulator [Burkholderia cenocepacia]MBJ9696812.1 TetR family transcriptional regulator [Burkholderia cenocepacia]
MDLDNVTESQSADDKPTRNKERTRAQILQAASDEFAERGLAGARIEHIASRAETNKRMVYYYYTSKEELFAAVLERTYKSIRDAERELSLLDQEPVEAIRTLVAFTWNYFLEHPEFIRLLNMENAIGASHVTVTPNLHAMNSPMIETLREVLAKGWQQKVFRGGVDALQLYISIASLSYFYLSNANTLTAAFGRNLLSARAKVERLHHMQDVVIGYLVID